MNLNAMNIKNYLKQEFIDLILLTFKKFDKEGKGAIVYMNQEGRGIGLLNKLKAYKLQEEGLDTYFELAYIVDPMTNSVILHITDFATPSDQESSAALWNQAISDLKRIIGA